MCIKTVFFTFRSFLFPHAIKVCDLFCVFAGVLMLLLSMMARCGAFCFVFLLKTEGFFFPLGLNVVKLTFSLSFSFLISPSFSS